MSITEELRTYAQGYELTVNHKLLEIADRIDRSYMNALECARDDGYDDGYQDGCAKQAEQGLVKLPRDKDDVPIRIGDTLNSDGDITYTVKGLMLSANGWEMVCDNGIGCNPKEFTHHHEPTIEDTLQELLEKAVGRDIAHTTAVRNTITEYAERIKEMTHDA